jgi:hypothetical protein
MTKLFQNWLVHPFAAVHRSLLAGSQTASAIVIRFSYS